MAKIDITGTDLNALIRHAYDLSVPQGLGYIHFTPDPLTVEEADEIIIATSNKHHAFTTDYINGRAVKLNAHRASGGKIYIHGNWFDHSDADLEELLHRCGLTENKGEQLA